MTKPMMIKNVNDQTRKMFALVAKAAGVTQSELLDLLTTYATKRWADDLKKREGQN